MNGEVNMNETKAVPSTSGKDPKAVSRRTFIQSLGVCPSKPFEKQFFIAL